MSEVNHWRRLVVWWLVATIIMLPVVIWLLAPGIPPGNGTVEGHGQVVDNTVLLATATPVATAVLVFFAYAIVNFREREPAAALDGPPITGNATVQTWWLVITTGLVLFLAAYGSIRMLADGAGGGQGPNPIAAPADSSHALQVQVIAQQWKFTYRYPSYGGVETNTLELPANRLVELHVTSLDVIHSFWAYELGVKADANPGVDNIAYVTTEKPMLFHVHCAELCGVWHGYMYDTGRVVSTSQFNSWIAARVKQFAPTTKNLGPYQKQYFPSPTRRA